MNVLLQNDIGRFRLESSFRKSYKSNQILSIIYEPIQGNPIAHGTHLSTSTSTQLPKCQTHFV